MELKASISYGDCEFKNEEHTIKLEVIESCLVILNNESKGYVRVLGKTRVYEQGYSSEDNIIGLITLDYKVKQIKSGDIIKILLAPESINLNK